jgi:hypothetical protein
VTVTATTAGTVNGGVTVTVTVARAVNCPSLMV